MWCVLKKKKSFIRKNLKKYFPNGYFSKFLWEIDKHAFKSISSDRESSKTVSGSISVAIVCAGSNLGPAFALLLSPLGFLLQCRDSPRLFVGVFVSIPMGIEPSNRRSIWVCWGSDRTSRMKYFIRIPAVRGIQDANCNFCWKKWTKHKGLFHSFY